MPEPQYDYPEWPVDPPRRSPTKRVMWLLAVFVVVLVGFWLLV